MMVNLESSLIPLQKVLQKGGDHLFEIPGKRAE